MLTYSATLDVPEETATLLVELLVAERLRRGTGVGARAATCRQQAILVLRWFRDDADMKILAVDTRVSTATGYRYLHEGIDVLAAQAPDLHDVLARGKADGWTHVTVDGTLIRTDRCHTKNPDTGHDLWYSGKHHAHGGNVQVVSDPTGFPVAVSDVEPRLGPRHHRRPRHRLPRRPLRRGRPARAARPGRQGLRRRRRRYPYTGQGQQPRRRHRDPQRTAQLRPRRRRTRQRPAQDPLARAPPHPDVPPTNRRHHRRRTHPDHTRTANPLRNLTELKKASASVSDEGAALTGAGVDATGGAAVSAASLGPHRRRSGLP